MVAVHLPLLLAWSAVGHVSPTHVLGLGIPAALYVLAAVERLSGGAMARATVPGVLVPVVAFCEACAAPPPAPAPAPAQAREPAVR